MGVLHFEFRDDPVVLEVHIYKGKNVIGKPTESDEMKPKWFHVDEIPFENMWPDDIHWMPLFLKDKKFQGKFLFDTSDTIVEMNLKEL